VSHHLFSDLPGLLNRGDLVIFNDTRVIPARLFCTRETGAAIELLFTRRLDAQRWECIGRPARRITPGTTLRVNANPDVALIVQAAHETGTRVIELKNNALYDSVDSMLESLGTIPLPPYITRAAQDDDRDRYQTVYSRTPGAVAAPTAGLHFTSDLIKQLQTIGIATATLTLHVGIGTFRPVSQEDPRDHPMHVEHYELGGECVEQIRATRSAGGRIIAVGTTTVRVLESVYQRFAKLQAHSGSTDLFILPGFRFGVTDGLITNFHLPKSTLLMLVSAFSTPQIVLDAYREAIEQRYRFFSYGDATLII
jgi:S-adenosylmethionine:tRNA ribosyltransferase-isomerase